LNWAGRPLTSEIRKVAVQMSMIFIDSIDYRILCDGNAAIQSCSELITALLPRNCVIFDGVPVSVTHLQSAALRDAVQALMIPHSLHTISDFDRSVTRKLEYLVVESGTELDSIAFGLYSLLSSIPVFATQSPFDWSKSLCILQIHRIRPF
jgi:hypothetical protein